MNLTRLLAFALCAVIACDQGFEQVEIDGSAETDSGLADGPVIPPDQTEPDSAVPDAGCTRLERARPPLILGFGGGYSVDSALTATPSGIAAVFERVNSGSVATLFAFADASGTVTVDELVLDEGDFASSPAIAGVGDSFGVVYVHDDGTPSLIFRRVDSSGNPAAPVELASNPGGYLSGAAIGSGPAGIAVGYGRHASKTQCAAQLGKIDPQGKVVIPFSPVSAADESWHVTLLPTSDGFYVAWSESKGDCWAVVVAQLDEALEPVRAPTVIADDVGCYQRPSFAGFNGDLLVCAERVPADGNAQIVCHLLAADGTLADPIVSSVGGMSSRRPQVAADDSGFAVLWTGTTTGLEEVYVRLFTAAGEPAGKVHRISEDGVRSFYPSVVWTDAGLFAAWYRYIPITVYYAGFLLSCDS